jgi:hypothetical protein
MKYIISVPGMHEGKRIETVFGPIEAESRLEAVASIGITVWTKEEWDDLDNQQ